VGEGGRERRGWAAGVASVRRHQKLPPSWTQLVPASSKMDPSLAKPELISDGVTPL